MTEVETEDLTPAKIVESLDRDIIGQDKAKRAVALAFRNRWRRIRVPGEEMREEITPKNILMIGPTGVGKTEVARRLAKLAGSPFIKVEATKFTEVGFVGRDVDSIIRDLMEVAHAMATERTHAEVIDDVRQRAIDRLVNALHPVDDAERRTYELRIKGGEMDDKMVEVKVPPRPRKVGLNISGSEFMPQQFEEISRNIGDMFKNINDKQQVKKRKVKLSEALEILEDEELAKATDENEIRKLAVTMAEESGIVFIDEIDKIAGSGMFERAQVSRQGVQRDLLPLIEGNTVQTKYGTVNTDHMLFIASGAFHYASPSDLIPELQGRLPVRVDLTPLSKEDFVKILSGKQHSLIEQYAALLETEGLSVKFDDGAVERIAEIAQQVNESQENIGARRLHTLMERVVEEVSFAADSMRGKKHTFTAAEVDKAVGDLSEDERAARIFL